MVLRASCNRCWRSARMAAALGLVSLPSSRLASDWVVAAGDPLYSGTSCDASRIRVPR